MFIYEIDAYKLFNVCMIQIIKGIKWCHTLFFYFMPLFHYIVMFNSFILKVFVRQRIKKIQLFHNPKVWKRSIVALLCVTTVDGTQAPSCHLRIKVTKHCLSVIAFPKYFLLNYSENHNFKKEEKI